MRRLALAILLWSGSALAHDAERPEFQEWYESLKMPDNPLVPCCGIGDAYFADVVRVRDGKTYAVITDDRPDRPLNMRHHVPVGTEIEVPKEKLKWDAGNPTGHVVIFLNVNNVALCYVQGSGI